MDLFEYNRQQLLKGNAPLASRMRPESLDDYAGQRMLPEELGDTTFFHLGDNKREQAIAEWFRRIGKK